MPLSDSTMFKLGESESNAMCIECATMLKVANGGDLQRNSHEHFELQSKIYVPSLYWI